MFEEIAESDILKMDKKVLIRLSKEKNDGITKRSFTFLSDNETIRKTYWIFPADYVKKFDLPVQPKISHICFICGVNAAFGYQKNAYYCSLHKLPGMDRIIKGYYCLECDKRASFGFEQENGAKVLLYCGDHKKEDMVNLNKKKCLKCDKSAFFNFITPTYKKKSGLYCGDHKKEGMVNIYKKKCLKCDKAPSFNYPVSFLRFARKRAIYCMKHKKEGMINVLRKKN